MARGVDVTPDANIWGFFPDATQDLPECSIDAITATNVLGHVDDVHAFMAEVERLLKPDGVLVVEVPYVDTLLRHAAFDTIYHEHLSYWSQGALLRLVNDHGLWPVDVSFPRVHGGSIRWTAMRHRANELGWATNEAHLLGARAYEKASLQWEARLDKIANLVTDGGRWAAFGAAAKGTVLACAAELGPTELAYVVDETPSKQGFLTPYGVPIVPLRHLTTDPVTDLLVLPWNWYSVIREKLKYFNVRVVNSI